MTRLFALAAASAVACVVNAFSPEEARSLYVKNYTESPPSVQESGDYVFVIQEGMVDYDDPSGIKAAVLKGQLAAIEKYVGKSGGGMESPFPAPLTEKLRPLVSFKIPECKSCKVDELRLVGKFRHVSAFEAGPLRKAREEAASGRPVRLSNAEWGELIAKKLRMLPDDAAREALWAEVGAAMPLVSRLGGTRWMVERADGVALCAALSKWRGDETTKECNAVLNLNPAFAPARMRMAEIATKDGDLVSALSRRFKASLSSPDAAAVSRAAELVGKKSGSSAWREYASLYGLALGKSSLAPEGAQPMWRYLVGTFGHIEPPSALPPNAAKAAQLFKEGLGLFEKGQELDRLVGLFRQSLELDATRPLRWRYYAAALRAAGRDVDAAVVYSQTLSMQPGDWTALADFALLCRKMKFRELSAGCAWYILATSSDEAARAKAEKALAK